VRALQLVLYVLSINWLPRFFNNRLLR